MIDLQGFEPVEERDNIKLDSPFEEGSQWEVVESPSMESAYQSAADANPEEVAEVRRLAKRLDVSPDAVSGNLELARKTSETPDFDKFKTGYPTLAGFSKDAWFMALAKDDLEPLSEVERSIGQWAQDEIADVFTDAMKRGFGNVKTGKIRSRMGDTPEARKQLKEVKANIPQRREDLNFFQKYPLNFIGEQLPLYISSFIESQEAGLAGASAGAVAGALIAAPTGEIVAPITAPAGAALGYSAGTASGMFKSIAEIESGLALDEMLEAGVPIETARNFATGVGIINGALELTGLGFIAKATGAKALAGKLVSKAVRNAATKAVKSIGKGVVKTAAKEIGKDLVVGTLGETVTETLQEASTIIGDALAKELTDDKEFATIFNSEEERDQAILRLAETAKEVALGMATTGGIVSSGRLTLSTHGEMKRQKAARTQQRISELATAIEATRLKNREPETFTEFVNRAAQANGSEGKVYLQSERLVEHLQSVGVSPIEWSKQYGVNEKQLTAALQTGGMVALDMGKVASNIGTDETLTALQEDFALKRDEVPASQVEESIQSDSDAYEHIKTLYDAEQSRLVSDQEVKTLEAQLVEAGVKEKDAQHNAIVYAARANTWAKQTGKTASEWFARWGVNVRREADASGVTYNQTGDINRDENFKRWFGDSKVVDETGKPLVVYHGSGTRDIESFLPDGGREGWEKTLDVFRKAISDNSQFGYMNFRSGSFFSPGAQYAGNYTGEQSGVVYPVYVKAKNPVYFDMVTKEVTGLDQTRTPDALILTENGKINEIAIIDPTQIKSVNNSGTFDPTDPRILYQPAFHGTPHKFDKFTLDHIGTGEGAQAYGWGLYFAGNKEVAEFYREKLSKRPLMDLNDKINQVLVNGVQIRENYDIEADELFADQIAGKDFDLAIEHAEDRLASWERLKDDETYPYRDYAKDKAEAWARLLPELKKGNVTSSANGQLYEANIPEDDVLLDWDKSIDEQPEKVRKVLLKWRKEHGASFSNGESAYNEFKFQARQDGAERDAQAASEYLNSLGIKGIKYLDGSSRSQGEGHHNYVIFDDSAIEILNTYYQDKTRASITFGGTVDIALLKGADRSSFLHETGHLFLEDLKRTAEEDGVGVEEWQTVKEFLGVDGELTTEQHEQFARSFEAYLREGKAPSIKLQQAFKQFRRWLVSLYRSLRQLDVELSDDVRQVFDKMLATDAEIQEAQDFNAQVAMFTDMAAKELGATEQEVQEYLSAVGGKLDEAAAIADKHRIAGRDERVKEWTVQAEADSKQVPIYRAIYFLTRNVFPEEGEGSKSGSGPGLNSAEVKTQYGEEVYKELPKLPGLWRTNGMTLDHAAAELGYDSGRALLDELRNMKPRQQWIEEQVATKEVEHDSELETEEAIRNALSLKQLEIESKWLAKKAQSNRKALNRKTLRTWAENQTAEEMVVDATDVYGLVVNSRKLRTQAIAAQKKGDYSKAFELNEKVRLNEELILARYRVREKLRKLERRLNGRANANIQNDYRNQLNLLLQRFFLTKKKLNIDADAPTLGEFIQSLQVEDELDALSMPVFAEWLQGEEAGPYKQVLTWQQLNDVADLADFLYGRGREELEGLLSDQKTKVEDAAMEAAAPSRKLKGRPVFKEGSLMRTVTSGARSFLARADMLQFVLKKKDGYTKHGDIGPNERMWRRLVEARNDRDAYIERLDAEIRPHLDVLIEGGKNGPKEYVHVPVPENMQQEGQYWTWERIVSVALNMGNTENIDRLLKGYAVTWNELYSLTSVLTEEHWKAVQGIWNAIDTMYADISRVHYNINHFNMGKVQATPLFIPGQESATVDGVKVPARQDLQLNGGYYPLKYDNKLSIRAAEWTEKDDILSSSYAIMQTPAAKSGFTKGRTGSSMPVKLSLSVLAQHVNDTIQYITHAETVRDLDRITRHEAYSQEAIRFLGREAYTMIRPALKYAIRPQKEWGGDMESWIDRQRVKATTFILAWNASVATKQVFSLPAVWKDIGFKNYLKGVSKVIQSPIESMQHMHEVSQYMKNRSNNLDRDLMDSLKHGLKPQRKLLGVDYDKVVNAGFVLIKMMDFAAVYPSWVAAYNKSMTETGNVDEARMFADETIRASQPSGQPIDLSALQRDSRGWMKLFTMFSTFTMKYGNRQRFFYGAWRSGQMKTHEYMWHVALESIFPPLMMNIVMGALQGRGDDDSDILTDVLTYQFIGLPVVRDVVGGIVKPFFGRSVLDSPAFTGIKLTVDTGKDVIDALKGKDAIEKLSFDILQLLSYASRIPVSQMVKRARKGMEQIEDGDGTVINLAIPDPKRR